jgi:lipopolysaccharide biosynthesis glycosyltransferase
MDNNIVVCSDRNYAKYVVTLFESIVHNTTLNINFYVIYSSINESDIKDITLIISQNSENTIRFIKFDFLKELEKLQYNEYVPAFRGGYDAYTRLFIPSILKPFGVKKCLYMDVDIIVDKNLDKLLSITQNIECIGGVLDTVSINLNIPLSKATYVNSGVLAMNLEMLEHLNFSLECLNFAKENKNSIVLFDQDIINNVFSDADNRITLLDFKYNTYHSNKSLVRNAIVLHFTGPYKPWDPTCRWRLKKCIWVKYNLAARLTLRGWNMTKGMIDFLGKTISSVRFWCNLWLKFKLMLKILK